MNDQSFYLGKRFLDWVPFSISASDVCHHVYVIGKTGSGKSTLLSNLFLQHVAQGRGVALIDPHGDLATDLIRQIPPHMAAKTVYFDAADRDFPIGINPLGGVPVEQRGLVVSGIVGALKNLWPDSWGPRMEYILKNAVAAVLHCEGVTLLGVKRMLDDASYREWVVGQIDDPFLVAYWRDEFGKYDERFRREAIAPIQNKLGTLTGDPVLRNIIGQVRNRIDFRFLMDEGRVFIANLAKGSIGADKANLIGSLLVHQFEMAALARASVPEYERRPFSLLVDEFATMTTGAFAAALSEIRKYGLGLILASQFSNQMSAEVRQAVFGNVGSIIAFRVGYQDAEILHEEFSHDYRASQFTELPRYQVLTKLMQRGEPSAPFRGVTLPPITTDCGRPQRVVADSRKRYAQPRAVVEAKLARWLMSRRKRS